MYNGIITPNLLIWHMLSVLALTYWAIFAVNDIVMIIQRLACTIVLPALLLLFWMNLKNE